MKLKVFGARGSIPAPSGKTIDGDFCTKEFGGNTTCYLIETDGEKKHIIDAGTGIRVLGLELMKQEHKEMNLYFTHTHWDHIHGFPFFTPSYIPNYEICIYGEAQISGDLIEALKRSDPLVGNRYLVSVEGVGIKDVLEQQQCSRNFPAPLSIMKGIGPFYDFIPGGIVYEDDFVKVEAARMNHPGGCISYKFTEKSSQQVFIISTDFEPDNASFDQEMSGWWKEADIVLADAQYEVDSKRNPFMKGWGHSDYITNIEFAKKSGLKNLILIHHEPRMDDTYLRELEQKAKNYLNSDGSIDSVNLAREGVTYTLDSNRKIKIID